MIHRMRTTIMSFFCKCKYIVPKHSNLFTYIITNYIESPFKSYLSKIGFPLLCWLNIPSSNNMVIAFTGLAKELDDLIINLNI